MNTPPQQLTVPELFGVSTNLGEDQTMVYGIDLFFALFNNLAIFIAIVTIYMYLLRSTQKLEWYKNQLIIGSVLGIFAIGCMYAKI
jgi:hypothetical protein